MVCQRIFAVACTLGLALGCGALPVTVADDDAETSAAVSSTPDTFHVGPLQIGLGKWTHVERKIPAGDPTYVIDIPDPGLGRMTCQIDTYYSIASTRPGLRAMDDNDGMLAAVASSASDAAELTWNYMVFGVSWTFAGEGVRLHLEPSTPIIDSLRVEAACQPR